MRWRDRLRIMRENRTIAESGRYTAADGTEVQLSCSGDVLAARTVFYPPEEIPESGDTLRKTPFRISDNLMQTDTISCIRQLRETETGEIVALNFANANVPGGGYRFGGDAQEESLCRCSMLYAAIAPQKEYYRWHRLHPTPFYSDRILISPHIPIIRTMDGTLTANPVDCTFVTCAAVNRRIAKIFLVPDKCIERTMKRRISRIVSLTAQRKPAVIVLGAFGCGAFGNKRKAVYPMIEAAVDRFVPDEIRVVFAAP